jgi:hypothetical protein
MINILNILNILVNIKMKLINIQPYKQLLNIGGISTVALQTKQVGVGGGAFCLPFANEALSPTRWQYQSQV